MGDEWVAFSPLSGETLVLNDESAAILEVLEAADATMMDVCAALADDMGTTADEVAARFGPSWNLLVDAGLIVDAPAPAA